MKSSTLHLYLAILWTLLLVPTLIWWREAIWWVAFVSIYGNISTHFGAYEAAKAKEKVDETP